MLILTRRVGEQLVIGDDICVEILSIRGNQIRIGIGAPGDVRVLRPEAKARVGREHDPGGVPRQGVTARRR